MCKWPNGLSKLIFIVIGWYAPKLKKWEESNIQQNLTHIAKLCTRMWSLSDSLKIAILRLVTHSSNQFGTSLSFQGAEVVSIYPGAGAFSWQSTGPQVGGFNFLFILLILKSYKNWFPIFFLLHVFVCIGNALITPQAGWRSSSCCPFAFPLLQLGISPR